ncbi:MAG: hypothetical protein KIC60_06075 [Clostridium sp.]|nr:hypothetical protein [Clostridium sp.]
MTEAKIENIKNDYLQGMKYRDIMQKYNITQPELRSVIRRNKLTRSKSELQQGNKNAIGNKGGHGTEDNKNAVVTGEYEKIYEDVLDEEELELYNTIEVNDKEQLLINDYKILTIREKRMLSRIKTLKQQGKDMTIDFIRKKNSKSETETVTEAQPTINIIQRIEEGLTRVQEAKRKTIESLMKINVDGESKDINLNINSTTPLLESINRQLGGGKNGRK